MSCLRLEFQLKHLNGIEQTTKLNKFANMTKPTKINNSKAQDLHINKNCQSIFDEEKSHNQKYIFNSRGSKLFSNLSCMFINPNNFPRL